MTPVQDLRFIARLLLLGLPLVIGCVTDYESTMVVRITERTANAPDLAQSFIEEQVSSAQEDDEPEHRQEPYGIALEWDTGRGQAAQRDIEFDSPNSDARINVINVDPIDYDVTLTVFGDLGTQQSRFSSSPHEVTVAAGATEQLNLQIRENAIGDLEYSGMVAVKAVGCPRDTGDRVCRNAISYPLYFHRPNSQVPGLRLYGEVPLGDSYNAGAIDGPPRDPGATRVMGGGPLHEFPTSSTLEERGTKAVELFQMEHESTKAPTDKRK